MNEKGFTLVELLATLVILGIVVGITIVGLNINYRETKQKTEEIFVSTLEDALKIYLDSNAKSLTFGANSVCDLHKTHGTVKLYKALVGVGVSNLTIDGVINSEYVPLTANDMKNPANKDSSDKYECSVNAHVDIYRDEDLVYYYRVKRKDLKCLKNEEGYITNLPSECENS